jgi:hypothetical protein
MRQSVVVGLFILTGLYAFALPRRSPWGERADAGFVPPANLRIDGDLVYARYGDRSLLLDLYHPAKVSREFYQNHRCDILDGVAAVLALELWGGSDNQPDCRSRIVAERARHQTPVKGEAV